MSKVQSPKSKIEEEEQVRFNGLRREPDLGPGTLDFGLKVHDLRKSFVSPAGERIEVLRGVSLHALPGESIAITGASGAGKSTLLHVMAGLEEPDHGTIDAGKFSLHSAAPSALARFRNERMGLVFQFHHLLKDLTAAENVALPLMINREASRAALTAADVMLNSAGLGHRSTHLIGNLSGGEQQRVAVCRALMVRPVLVLADEPTGNLDAAASEAIATSLVDYARNTPAMVIVATHSSNLAAMCDRRLSLKDGRLHEY
ncbi:MAG TPA: ABC transporter ATP-binding protein [Pyrinomonadaceae bacterium]|nr:ABC transporter ATP-binding protein [Pyrinomonadaceae bacterium]